MRHNLRPMSRTANCGAKIQSGRIRVQVVPGAARRRADQEFEGIKQKGQDLNELWAAENRAARRVEMAARGIFGACDRFRGISNS